jgi:hypothetical protein
MVNIHDLIGLPDVTAAPFHASHLYQLELDKDAIGPLVALDDLATRAERAANSEFAITVFYKLQTAACFGLNFLWPGTAEGWLLPSKVALEHPQLLTRGTMRFFDTIGPAMNLRRVQIVVCVDHKRAVRWAKFLGFTQEGRMAKYGPEGKDYYLFARTY